MNRWLAYLFVGIMLITVVGQGIKLLTYDQEPVREAVLHESQLLPFLYEIQSSDPQIYANTLFNLSRIRHARRGRDRYQFEEIVAAQTLMQRLTGVPIERFQK
ncbi:MAG: hypothetical protein ETSY1_25925 [Candidatus Entotheonella factor]|uniref:Uncharacterized protein n=1 Tax=Entotheonella factor TaxID=1429438 RepID=W4LGZ0_ENTF1|nr:MAG: hypothetical protein ETSY1_25925 [Candidatus Entotheonella factor]